MIEVGTEFKTHNDARVKVVEFAGEFVRLHLKGYAEGYASFDAAALKELRKYLKKLQKQLESNAF